MSLVSIGAKIKLWLFLLLKRVEILLTLGVQKVCASYGHVRWLLDDIFNGCRLSIQVEVRRQSYFLTARHAGLRRASKAHVFSERTGSRAGYVERFLVQTAVDII